jgi:hypothetical protein
MVMSGMSERYGERYGIVLLRSFSKRGVGGSAIEHSRAFEITSIETDANVQHVLQLSEQSSTITPKTVAFGSELIAASI